MTRSAPGALLALLTLAVACTPATFDGLTGGPELKEPINPHAGEIVIDETLEAPRPIGPISVSWVNTQKPKFRWELGERSTGAVIEVSQTRDFSGEVRRYQASGTEYVLKDEEALPPGMWYWRLRGRIAPSDTTPQETQGPALDAGNSTVWQVLVRGAGPKGTPSDAANGSIFDMNGDGIPEIAVTAVAAPEFFPKDYPVKITKPTPIVLQWIGQKDGSYLTYEQGLWFEVSHANASLTGGVDLDGDGFADFVPSSLWEEPEAPGGAYGEAWIFHGGPQGWDSEKDEFQGRITAPYSDKLPFVQAAGDVNGDGYGDIAMLLPDLTFAALGSRTAGATTMMVLPSGPVVGGAPGAPVASRALFTSCDLDNDGMSDIAISSSQASSPLSFSKGSRERFDPLKDVPPGNVSPTPAIAIASGDVNGDGLTDFVFSTTLDGAPAVCVYTLDTGPLDADRCWKGEGDVATFGKSIATADIDEDGRDDIIVTTGAEIVVLQRTDEGTFQRTPIAGPFAGSLTVIHPGRPGAARWAAISADKKSINVFHGLTPAQKLDISKEAALLELGPTMR